MTFQMLMRKAKKCLAAASVGFAAHSTLSEPPSLDLQLTSHGPSLLSTFHYIAHAKSAPLPQTSPPSSPPPAPSSLAERLKRRAEIMRFGYPTLDNISQREDHVLAYSNFHRSPLWVCEHLTETSINITDPGVDRSNSKFRPCPSTHPYFAATNGDYLGSGYDRGHMAAAANHRYSQTAMDETFLLDNICPQTGAGLNRTKWNELEKRARTLARKHASVHVLTGPLYLPTVSEGEVFLRVRLIGKNNVAVPTHFFKVLLVTERGGGSYQMECYVMPNEPIRDDLPLTSFMVPKAAIEKGAGFFVFEFVADSQLRMVNRMPNPNFVG